MTPVDMVTRYGLVRPAMGDALVAVSRAHGPNAVTVWGQLLAAAGLAGHESDDNALHRMIEAMAAADPVLQVCARSLRIRLTAYTQLAAQVPVSTAPVTAGSNP